MKEEQAVSWVVIGLDLGQAADYTALAIVEGIGAPGQESRYNVRRVERLPLGTPYPTVVQQIKGLFDNPLIKGAALVVDAMGVGSPVVDMLREEHLYPVAVKVHGGSQETQDEKTKEWHVPKRNLVSTLRVLLENKQIEIAPFPQLDALLREIQNYRVTISQSGHDSYEAWREADHDDMVFALGLACWWAKRRRPQKVEYRSIERRWLAGLPDDEYGESPLARRRAEQERVWAQGNPFGRRRGIF